MLKAYKYRIYPNNEQKVQIEKTFGCCRFVYNQTLAYRKFFREHAGYPKFKSKHDNHKSYTTNFTNGNITVDFDGNKVKLPKLKGVKVKLHRKFSGQI